MTDDLEELERKAKAATPGPWHHCQPFLTVPKQRTPFGTVPAQRVDYVSTWPGPGTPKGHRVVVPMPREDGPGVKSNDMAHIAAANPATILALIAENRALKEKAASAAHYAAQVVEMEARLARMREALKQEVVRRRDWPLQYGKRPFCKLCQRLVDTEPHAPSCLLSTEGDAGGNKKEADHG